MRCLNWKGRRNARGHVASIARAMEREAQLRDIRRLRANVKQERASLSFVRSVRAASAAVLGVAAVIREQPVEWDHFPPCDVSRCNTFPRYREKMLCLCLEALVVSQG